MKPEKSHKPPQGKICSYKNVYADTAGTTPAKVGDIVARVDWDDGTPNAIKWHMANAPTLGKDEEMGFYLDFSAGASGLVEVDDDWNQNQESLDKMLDTM